MERIVRIFLLLVLSIVLLGWFSKIKAPVWSKTEDWPKEVTKIFEVIVKKNEPIVQPVNNIQKQADQLVESVKNLPEEQLKAVKRQLYQDFCVDLLKE